MTVHGFIIDWSLILFANADFARNVMSGDINDEEFDLHSEEFYRDDIGCDSLTIDQVKALDNINDRIYQGVLMGDPEVSVYFNERDRADIEFLEDYLKEAGFSVSYNEANPGDSRSSITINWFS